MDRTYNVDAGQANTAWNDEPNDNNANFYIAGTDGSNVKRRGRVLRPSYGYSMEYDTKFRMFSYGDGYYSISPIGVNPMTVTLSLNYEGLKYPEQGAEQFNKVNPIPNIIGFLEATQGENFTFLPPEPFCKYNNFRCEGYSTNYGNHSDTISVTLIGSSQSSLNINRTDEQSYGVLTASELSTLYLGEASEFTGNYKKAEVEPLEYDKYRTTGYNDRITRLNGQGTRGLIATTSDSYEPFEMRLRGWQKDTFYSTHSVVSLVHSSEPTTGGFEKYRYAKEDHVSVAAGGGNLPSAEHVERYWSSEFHWNPSEGSVNAGQSRVMMSEFGEGRTEVISDGRNANPLVFNFQFNNRSDIEAYAILHYLESRRGHIRFPVLGTILPTPYYSTNFTRYFICGKWSFTKNFLNNNSISATFIEDPLGIDLAAQSYDDSYTSQP